MITIKSNANYSPNALFFITNANSIVSAFRQF